MARVYLDASFVRACVTDRTDPKSIYLRDTSVEWWTTQRGFHELFVSQEVIDELSNPRFRRTAEALAWIHEIPLLSIDEQVGQIARLLDTSE
jgi:hypothetical protein